MYLPIVLSYPEFFAKIKSFIGPDVTFLYTREPDCKMWKFASLYLCLEDIVEDRKLYANDSVAVDFRTKPLSGGRLEVAELNENLEGAGWHILRFIEQECPHSEDGFVLTVEIKETL